MAVTEQVDKQQCTLRLDNGRDSSGNVKTVNMNLGSMAVNGWDAQKVINITDALTPCLSKGVHGVAHVETSLLISE